MKLCAVQSASTKNETEYGPLSLHSSIRLTLPLHTRADTFARLLILGR